MSNTDIINLVGLLSGPVIGVIVAYLIQRRSQVNERRLYIFRTLMRTRRSVVDPAYVEALNVVEVDFYGKKPIIDAYQRLLDHYANGYEPKFGEVVTLQDNEETKSAKFRAFNGRVAQERNELRAKLIHSIGTSLGYRVDQLDIVRGGYGPKGFADLEEEQKSIRSFIVELRNGSRTLPVSVVSAATPATDA